MVDSIKLDRGEVTLQVSDLQTISFQKYTEGLASPTHLTLFKIEPLKGVCLLNLSPRLGLTIVDRLLGGPAQSVNLSRELSELETALLDQVGQIVLNEWCQLWPKLNALRPVLLGHENNGRFLTSSPYDCIMLVLSIGVKFGECSEPMELVFPFHTIEPVVRQPEPTTTAESNTAPTRLGLSSWNPNLDDVEVQLDIEWHGLELSAGALSRLKCGDVLMLEENCFDRVEVQLAQQHKFKGRLGSTGDRWAVELTEIVKP